MHFRQNIWQKNEVKTMTKNENVQIQVLVSLML